MLSSREKLAHLTLLTGGMGAGKSTWAGKHQDDFDLVLGTDTGKPKDGGGYRVPTTEEKEKLRQAMRESAMVAHRRGERVLVEGYPRGMAKHPELIQEADRKLHLQVNPLTRAFRVMKRSRQRGSSMLEDLKRFKQEMPLERDAYEKLGPGWEKVAALLPTGKAVTISKTKQKHIDSWDKREDKEHLVSTNLGTVAYNPSRKTMHVEFAKGGLYRYSGVDPETYANLLAAKASHGKHFHKNVKEQGFKYRRLV